MPNLIIRSQTIAAKILFIIAMAKVFTWLVAMQQTTQLIQTAFNALALPPLNFYRTPWNLLPRPLEKAVLRMFFYISKMSDISLSRSRSEM